MPVRGIQEDQSTSALRFMPFAAELSAARDEVHRLALNDINTGDTFTLTYDGVVSASISYNATPATLASNIDTAIEGMSGWGAGTVSIAHVTGNTFDITYTGSKAALSVNLPTITPTGFTPTGVTRTVTGGVINSPALGETFSVSELKIAKNDGSFANTAGTVTENGEGAYSYAPTTGEVDTPGYVMLSVHKTGLAANLFVYEINPVATTEGETVIATGTAQAGSSANDIKLAADVDELGNFFIPCRVDITGGTGAGQGGRLGHSYNNSNKLLGIEPAWIVTPDNTSQYKLTSIAPIHADVTRLNHQVAGTFGGDYGTPADVADELIARGDELATEFMDLADGVEVSLTLRQAMRLLSAVMVGEAAVGGGGTTVTFRNAIDTKDRVIATVDNDGQRTAITTDPD